MATASPTEVQRHGPPEGDCEHGDKGNFPEFTRRGLQGALLSLRDCARLCAGCARCRYISMSLAPDVLDCSWYAACDLHRTRVLSTGPDFVSVSLRDAQRYEAQCNARFGSECLRMMRLVVALARLALRPDPYIRPATAPPDMDMADGAAPDPFSRGPLANSL